jgi:hypothetical protein
MSVKLYREDARRLRALAVQAADEDERDVLLGMANLCEELANRPRARETDPITLPDASNQKAEPHPGATTRA